MSHYLQQLKEIVACVFAGDVPNGAAFLIDESHVVTALHVLNRRREVRLHFPEWRSYTDAGERTATLQWVHPAGLDLAVLTFAPDCPAQVTILPWGKAPGVGTGWYTFGFPRNVPGGHVSAGNNIVEDPEKRVEGIPSSFMQLSSDIAAQDLGGFSGAPCVVGGEIIGVLAHQLYRDDEPLFKALYGLPMALLKEGHFEPPSPISMMDLPVTMAALDWQTYREQLHRTNLRKNRGKYIADEKRFKQPLDDLSHETILALHGSFGRGKSRMAEEMAGRALDQYPDGIWVVELEHVPVAEGILPAIASAMELEVSGPVRIDTLVNRIGRGAVLLILDGCERLVDECMAIGAELFNRCSGLKVLLTTQNKVHGSWNIDVPLLEVPPTKDAPDVASVIEKYEAVRFLVYQASKAGLRLKITKSNAASIAELCRQARGVPLELMLVAGSLSSTTVDKLIAKLKGREEGAQATADEGSFADSAALRGTLEVCSSELDEFQNTLLLQLAVLCGPFTEAAARAVAGDTFRSGDFNTVVDRSFVDRMRDRDGQLYYLMLSATRQFFWQRAQEQQLDRDLQNRHLGHYLETVPALNRELKGGEQSASLNQLEKEHENILAAIDFAWASGRIADGASLASEMRRFWFLRGFYGTGRTVLERALSRLPNTNRQLRAQLLTDAGILARMESEYEVALRYLHEAIEIANADGLAHTAGTALNALGILQGRKGDWEESRSTLDKALAIGKTIGDMNLQAWAYNGLTNAAIALKNPSEAKDLALKSFTLKQRLDDKRGMAMSQVKLGQLELQSGNIKTAKKLFERALETRRELGYRAGVGEALTMLARIAIEQNDAESAQEYLLEALKAFMALQDRSRLASILDVLKKFASMVGADDRADAIAAAHSAVLAEIGAQDENAQPSSVEIMLGTKVEEWQDTVIGTMTWLEER